MCYRPQSHWNPFNMRRVESQAKRTAQKCCANWGWQRRCLMHSLALNVQNSNNIYSNLNYCSFALRLNTAFCCCCAVGRRTFAFSFFITTKQPTNFTGEMTLSLSLSLSFREKKKTFDSQKRVRMVQANRDRASERTYIKRNKLCLNVTIDGHGASGNMFFSVCECFKWPHRCTMPSLVRENIFFFLFSPAKFFLFGLFRRRTNMQRKNTAAKVHRIIPDNCSVESNRNSIERNCAGTI